ncbi:MAG: hypothetical protein ACRDTP_07690, partial [Mycobacteriales bacterium]
MSDGGPLDLGTVHVGGRLPSEPAVPEVPAAGWDGRGADGSLDGVGLFVRRGNTQVLRGVDAHALPGRPLALTGPSGSGKSTLL